MDVIKLVGKYLNTPVGTLCYNTDKVLTTALGKENVEGFASIVLRLASKSNQPLKQEDVLRNYQWLEHISMYGNQALTNPVFAKSFLQGINSSLEKNAYLSGDQMSITDITAYYILYPIIERLSLLEQESLIHVCRWSKHIQAQPKVSPSVPLWKREPLPKQILPHELRRIKILDDPVIYFPQPFSYPRYPVILYL